MMQTWHKQLLHKLREHYGKLPSCIQLARDFSLLAREVQPISAETARKWLRGKSMPHARRMQILCAWLDIDFLQAGQAAPEHALAQNQPATRLALLLPLLEQEEQEALMQTALLLLEKRGLSSHASGETCHYPATPADNFRVTSRAS